PRAGRGGGGARGGAAPRGGGGGGVSGRAGWGPRGGGCFFPAPPGSPPGRGHPPPPPRVRPQGGRAGAAWPPARPSRGAPPDPPTLVKAILPHEVPHVVLADLFPQQQIPRWADEGMAVLAEPASEQSLRAADLDQPLRASRLFKVRDLVVMDYPAPEHWGLY